MLSSEPICWGTARQARSQNEHLHKDYAQQRSVISLRPELLVKKHHKARVMCTFFEYVYLYFVGPINIRNLKYFQEKMLKSE